VREKQERQLAVLLACFAGQQAAARARRPLDAQLRAQGDDVLDTVVGEVDTHHHARVYDPRRVVAGTLTPALTWGVFGLLTGGGVWGAVVSGILGALCGGVWAYVGEHALTKSQLTRLGACLPAGSSALLIFADTSDSRRLLEAAAGHAPRVASAAAVADDLTAHVVAGPSDQAEQSRGGAGPAAPVEQPALLSMITLRYPDPATAEQVASRVARTARPADAPQIELVLRADRSGRRHVTDPGHGAAYMARSNVVSWGGFGLVFGAVAGAIGGGGLLGLLGHGLVTGVAWGLFGLVAGLLYGRWAGQATSAGRLRGVGRLLAPGTSMLLAWADGPVSQETLDLLGAPGAQRLVLHFAPVEGGAVLEAA
jgi:hypothetical protein